MLAARWEQQASTLNMELGRQLYTYILLLLAPASHHRMHAVEQQLAKLVDPVILPIGDPLREIL